MLNALLKSSDMTATYGLVSNKLVTMRIKLTITACMEPVGGIDWRRTVMVEERGKLGTSMP